MASEEKDQQSVLQLDIDVIALLVFGNLNKKKLTLSNVPFLLPGLCAICGVSVFANMLVTNFWISTAGMYQQGMMQTLTTR